MHELRWWHLDELAGEEAAGARFAPASLIRLVRAVLADGPPGEPYRFDMGGGFVPYRRDVRYVSAQPAPIAPLLDQPHMQIVSFLKDTHAMGHGHANAIVAHQLAQKKKGA